MKLSWPEPANAYRATREGLQTDGFFLPKTNPNSLNVIVPAGIGDVYWILTKWGRMASRLRNVTFWLPDGEQHRAGALFRMMGLRYGYIQGLETGWVWERPGAPEIPEGETGWMVVHANRHLEAGRRIEDWYPQLPAEYPKLPDLYETGVRGQILVFICIREYMGGNLSPADWADIIAHIEGHHGPVQVVGAGKDVEFAEEVQRIRSPAHPPLYNLPLEEMFSVIKRARAAVGVASGLMILAGCNDIPTVMGYPSHLTSMPGSWEPRGASVASCQLSNLYETVSEGILGTIGL